MSFIWSKRAGDASGPARASRDLGNKKRGRLVGPR